MPVRGQGIYVEMSLLAAEPDLRRLDTTMIWRWQRGQKQTLQLPLLMDENQKLGPGLLVHLLPVNLNQVEWQPEAGPAPHVTVARSRVTRILEVNSG